MKNYTLICLILSLILWRCQKDDSASPERRFVINATVFTDASISLKWNTILDTTKVNNYYDIYLDKQLYRDSNYEHSITILNLKHSTKYNLKIVARTNGDAIDSAEISFTTKINYPPINLKISLDSLTSSEVTIFRTNSQDPEGKPVTYKIFVNRKEIENRFVKKSTRIKGLTPNANNDIEVVAIDSQGNTDSQHINAYTNATEGSLLHRYYLTVNGIKKECTLYFPPQYNQNSNFPLLFFFHGATGHGWDDAQSMLFREIADKEGIILSFPQAETSTTVAPSWAVDPGHPTDELPFATQLIDELIAKYSIDSKRVYATGMSSGGFMSFYMGQYIPEKLAAIAPSAATPTHFNFDRKKINQPLPLLIIFGTEDELIKGGDWSLSIEETLDFWIKNNHCSPTPIVRKLPDVNHSNNTTVTLFEYPDTTNNGNRILYYRMNGAGHWWPGGRTEITDIRAETVIWDFFKEIRRK